MPVRFCEHVFPSGLRVVAEVDESAHSAAVGFFVRTGARDEPDELMGVSHFLEHMMFKGPEEMTAEELNRRFDAIGARANAYTTTELTCFHAHVLPEHLLEATALLARMLRPALRTGDFEREKLVILEEIAMYRDEPSWVLLEEAVSRHWRGHGLGHRVLGTPETIRPMSVEQMRWYLEQRYSADNTVVALAGRMDFEAILSQIAATCATWRRTGASRDARRPPAGGGEFILRDTRVARAYTIMLSEAPPAQDDRRYAAVILARILGGPDNSRLHWALIEPGLAEEASAGYDPHDGAGNLSVFLASDPDRADAILHIARQQIDRLADSVTDDDLDLLRNQVATAITLAGERPADRMHRLGRQWLYLGRYLTLEEELERVLRLQTDDLRDLCRAFPPVPRTIGRLMPDGQPVRS